MKRRPCRRRWLIPLGFLLAPPLFWAAVLSIAPTGWARQRIVARLGQATGRPVALGALRIGPLGGIKLTNLEIGAPDKADDPWLKVARARINVSVLQLLLGPAEPTDIQAEGLSLRVLRRRDGTLELSDMLQAGPAATTSSSEPCPIEAAGVAVRFRDARVILIDEPSRTRLELTGVEGHATWQDRHAAVHDLRGTLNGGRVQLVASLDRSGPEPSFEGHLRASGVTLDEDMDALAYLVPVLSGDGKRHAGGVEGRLDATVYLRGRGITRAAVHRSLVGQGTIAIDPIQLDGSPLLGELAEMVDMPSDVRDGSAKTDFTIRNGRISTDALTLNIAKLPIVLSGWTDFDGRLDYRVRADRLADRLSNQARDLLSDLSIDLAGLSALHVSGTIDAMDITMDAAGSDDPVAAAGTDRRGGDRRPLRDLSRRLRDRLLR
jgi:uncharacterized protein involved in outer membrane biogenesis